MYVAPARAASSAWLAEKISVMFTLMPSAESSAVAASPSSLIATLTTTFSCHSAMRFPSSNSSSAVDEIVSAEIGPSIVAAISSTRSRYSTPSFATSEGFVVTPSITPSRAARRMSSMLAVSMNRRIVCSYRCRSARCGAVRSFRRA